MVTVKLTKKKAKDRIIKDLKESIVNLEGINDQEVELIPNKYLSQLTRNTEIISVVADMLSDMEYEG